MWLGLYKKFGSIQLREAQQFARQIQLIGDWREKTCLCTNYISNEGMSICMYMFHCNLPDRFG